MKFLNANPCIIMSTGKRAHANLFFTPPPVAESLHD